MGLFGYQRNATSLYTNRDWLLFDVMEYRGNHPGRPLVRDLAGEEHIMRMIHRIHGGGIDSVPIAIRNEGFLRAAHWGYRTGVATLPDTEHGGSLFVTDYVKLSGQRKTTGILLLRNYDPIEDVKAALAKRDKRAMANEAGLVRAEERLAERAMRENELPYEVEVEKHIETLAPNGIEVDPKTGRARRKRKLNGHA